MKEWNIEIYFLNNLNHCVLNGSEGWAGWRSEKEEKLG